MADSQAHSNPIHAVWANSALQLRNEAAARLFYLASQLRGNDVAQRPAFISLARRLYSGMEGVDWIAAGLKFLQPQDMAAMIVILTRGSETQTAPVADPMARPLVHDPRLAPRPFAAEERRPPPSREPQNLNAQRKLQAEQAAAAAAAARSKITVGDVMRQLRVAKREAVLGVLRKAAMAAEKAAPGSGSGGFPVSLIDPLTILRIRLPGRGCRCTHLQPFDVLVMAEQVLVKKPQSFVRCPVLGCPSVFNVIEDLAHDELLLSIIKSVPATCEQVLIFTDGTFRMLAPTKPVKTEIDLTAEDSPLMKQRALGTGMPAVSAAYSNAPRVPVPTPGIVSPSIALDVMDTTTPRPAGFATSGGFPVDTLLPAATATTPPASGAIGNFEVPFTFGLQSAERQVPSPSPLGVSSGVPSAAGRPVATSTAAPMEGVTTTSTAPRVTTPIPSPATTPRVPSMPPTPAAAPQSLLQGGPALLLPGSSAAPAPPAAVRTPSLLDGVSVGLDMRHVVMDNMLNKFIANSSTAAVSAANSPYTPRVSTPPGASPTTTPKQSRANKPAAAPAPAPSKPSPSATRTAASASHGGRVRPPTQPALPVQNQALAAAVAAATLSPRPEGSSAERAMRKAEMRKTDYRSIVEQYRAAGAPLPPNLQAQVDRDAAAAAGVEVPNVVTSTTTTPPAVGQKRSDSPPAPGEEPPRKRSRTSNEGVGLNLSGESAASGGGTRPPDEMDLTTTEELEHGFVALQPQHTTGNVMVTKRRPATEPAPAKAKPTIPTTPRFAGPAMGALPAHLVPPTERPRKDAARSGTGSPRMQSVAPPVGNTRPGQAPLRQQLQGPPELVPTSARLAEPTMKRLTPRAGNSSSPLTSPRMQSRGFDMPTPPTAAPAPPHPAAGKGPAAKASRPAYPVAGKAPVAGKSPAVKAPPAPVPAPRDPVAAPMATPTAAAVDPDLMELENLEASLRALNESAEDTLRLHDQYTEVLKTASPMRRRANEPTPPPAIPMPENLEPWTSTAEALPLEDPLQMPQLDTSLDSSLGAPLDAPLLADALLDLPLDGKTRETPELPPSMPIPDLATTMHVAASMLILPDNLPVPPPASHYYSQRKSGESSPGVTPVPMEVAAPMLEATAPLEVAAPALMESSTPRAAEDAYMTYQAESKPFFNDDSPHGEEAVPQQELVGSAENNAPAVPPVEEVPLPVDEVAPAPLSEPAPEPVQEPVEEPVAEPPVAASELTSESEMSGHAPIQVAPEPMETSAGLVVQAEPEPVPATEEPAPESVPEPSPDAIAREPEFAAEPTPAAEPVAAIPAVEETAAPEPMDTSSSAPVPTSNDVDDEEQDALLEQLLSSTDAPMAEASHPVEPVVHAPLEPVADEPSDSPKEVTVTMPAAEPDVMPMDISDPMDVSVDAQHAEEPTAPPVSHTVASTPARHGEPTPMGTPAPPAVDVVVEPIISQKTSRANTPPSNVDALGALDAALAFFESQQTPRAAVPATRNLFGSGAAVVKVEPSPGEATEAPARESNDADDDDDDELMPLGQLLGVQSVAPTTPTSSHAPYIPAVKPHSVPLVAVPGALPATQHRVLWVDATRSVPRTGPAPQGLRPLEDGIVLTAPRNPTQARPAK